MNTTDQTTDTDDFDVTPQFADRTLEAAREDVDSIRRQLVTSYPLIASENYSSDGVLMVGNTKFQLVKGNDDAITLRVTDGDKQIGEYAFDANGGLDTGDYYALLDALRQE